MAIRLSASFLFVLIFWVFTLSASPINSINKQYTFNSITIEDGLSINSIKTIGKDALGYIWVGTSNGLNRYDGYSVSSYFNVEGDSTSLINNGVFSLFTDSKGRFWIGTNRGLCRYDFNKNNFIHNLFVLENKTVNCFIGSMCEDKNGNIWIGTSLGLFSMNVETLETEYFPVINFEKQSNIFILKLQLESDSILNIGTLGNGFVRYNILNKTYKQYLNIPGDETSISENRIETLFQDLEGAIWIGTNNNGMNIFNLETNSFTRIVLDETNERSKRVRCITQDQQGRYWFGTRDGLYTNDTTGKRKFDRYAHSDHIVSKLTNNSITDIYIDNSGIMWLGTYEGGVNYTNLSSKRFYHFKYVPDNNQFLNNKIVQCFAEDKKGNIWIGTENGGLNVLNKETGIFSYYTVSNQKNSLSNNNVKCLAFDDNNGLWIGTNNGGLNYFDIDKNKFYHFTFQEGNENSIPSNNIYSLLYDSNKNLWVGTGNGLCLINKNHKIHRFIVNKDYISNSKYEDKRDFTVFALSEDKDRNIYVSMVSYGLFQFQKADSSFKRLNIQEYDNPTNIYQDTEKKLWLGTRNGLFLITDFTNSVYTRYSVQDGLPSNYICGVLEDENKNLWISTTAGLVKFINAVNNPHSANFIIYDQADGLQSKQFFDGAVLKSEDGQLFFGGIHGFNAFYPVSLEDNKNIPPVYINEFLIFNKPVAVGEPGSPLQNVVEQTKEIVLSWKQSVFSFGFIAINYIHPEKNRYSYKMEGFDKDWNYTNNSRRMATYTNLDPGEYTFHVKASNNDGVWNEQGTSVTIRIIPPWWRTWLFRGIVAVILMALVYTGFRIRIRSIHRQSQNLKLQVAERTVQLEAANKELEAFSYSVSHDLRAPLRSIDGFSQILLEEYQDKLNGQGKNYLQRVRSGAQRMAQLIDDMLKLSRVTRNEINIRQVNLSKMAKELASDLSQTQPEREVEFIIQEGIQVQGDDQLLRMVMVNLLENAWKYTSKHQKSRIEFGMQKQKEGKVYFVRDDGAGFEMNFAQNIFGAFQRLHTTTEFPGMGIGLATVQRIIHRHGGNVWAEGEVEKGATFYFTIPKPITS